MDTRQVSPGIRRRVGQGTCTYSRSSEGGVHRSLPMGTDWQTVEGAFEAQAAKVKKNHYGVIDAGGA